MYNANLNLRLPPNSKYVKSTILIFQIIFPNFLRVLIPNPCRMSVRTSVDGEHTIRRFAHLLQLGAAVGQLAVAAVGVAPLVEHHQDHRQLLGQQAMHRCPPGG